MIRIIVAIDERNGIAKNGVQPWSLPNDEAYFKKCTSSHDSVILMGRRTFEVIGGPLTGRRNIVASRTDLNASGVEVVHDITGLLNEYRTDKDIWVIGGMQVYKQAIPITDELYITKIYANFECDQFFPTYETSFTCVCQSELQTENGLKYQFTRYERL